MEKVLPHIYYQKMPPHGPPSWDVSNVYFAGKDEVVLIDAGYPTPESINSILGAWRELGRPTIKAILLTHAHLDHIGAAPDIARETGASIYAHPHEAKLFNDIFPNENVVRTIDEGDEVDISGIKLKVLGMPGHTSGHLCFLDESSGSLFTGDLVVGSSYAIIIPPDGDMIKYMACLHRMKDMSLKMIMPGHGPPVNDPGAKIEEYITHRILREMQILKQLEDGPKSIPDMAEEIYADLHPALRNAGRMQILAHLVKMELDNQVDVVSGEGTEAVYRSNVGSLPF